MPKGKLNMAERRASKPKPWWWKPLWITTIILIVASGIVTYFIFDTPLLRAVGGLVLTLFCVGIAYYIRVKPSMRINRALYILLGITPLGFVLWVTCIYALNRTVLVNKSGTWPFAIVCFIVCFGLGAFIGDWIGKRRGYLLPLTP
jgi:hypothetical protein